MAAHSALPPLPPYIGPELGRSQIICGSLKNIVYMVQFSEQYISSEMNAEILKILFSQILVKFSLKWEMC